MSRKAIRTNLMDGPFQLLAFNAARVLLGAIEHFVAHRDVFDAR